VRTWFVGDTQIHPFSSWWAYLLGFSLISYSKAIFTKMIWVKGGVGVRKVIFVLVVAFLSSGCTSYLLKGAIKQGDNVTAMKYINKKAYIHAMSGKGVTALHQAVKIGSLEITKALLKAGVEVNARKGCSATPLYYAIKYNYTAIADLLQENGAYLFGEKERDVREHSKQWKATMGQTDFYWLVQNALHDVPSVEYMRELFSEPVRETETDSIFRDMPLYGEAIFFLQGKFGMDLLARNVSGLDGKIWEYKPSDSHDKLLIFFCNNFDFKGAYVIKEDGMYDFYAWNERLSDFFGGIEAEFTRRLITSQKFQDPGDHGPVTTWLYGMDFAFNLEKASLVSSSIRMYRE